MAKYSNGKEDLLDIPDSSVTVLESRYLAKDGEGNVVETGEELFRRVAKDIAVAELLYSPEFKETSKGLSNKELYELAKESAEVKKREEEFFNIMARGYFLPNSPTLMNAGRKLQQLSACFVLPVEDSVEEIFDTLKNMAIVHKTGGGTGFAFSRLRPNGAFIHSTQGYSPGPLSFLFGFNESAGQITQGGKRRGANMGIIRANHPDALCWAKIKEEEGVLSNFNLSIAFSDKEMENVKNDDYILMEDPREGKDYTIENARKRAKEISFGKGDKFRTSWKVSEDGTKIIDVYSGDELGKIEDDLIYLKAKKLFGIIVEGAWKKGEPGIIFIDKINRHNPTPEIGEIESTNPCVVGDSLIPSERGLIRIDRLANLNQPTKISLDSTDIPNENGLLLQLDSAKVSKVWQTGVKETFKLVTKSGYELEATKNHKVLTKNGWKELQDLELGEKIILQSKEGIFSEEKRLPTSFNNLRRWSGKFGQILGLLVGDGWLSEKSQRVGFCFGEKDRKIFEYYKKILNEIYKKDIKEVKRENNTIHLSYHSKEFLKFFERLGVKITKSNNKEIPSSIFSAPREAIIGFLQGLFTADGTISVSKNKTYYIRLTSKSEKLLKQVQVLLINFGIKSKIYDRHRKKRIAFSYKNIKGELKLYETNGKLFELQISKDRIPEFLSKIGFVLDKHSEKIEILRGINFYKTQFEDEVVLKIPQGEKPVFDLTEPLTHSFIANGIVVHNCGEQPLLPYESCNLGSIDLSKMINEFGQLDDSLLEKTIRSAVRFLDNVIDRNKYSLKQIEKITKENRKIGLGVMGFAHMLIKLKISYNSPEAIEMAEKIMKFINDVSKDESKKLAKERGAFPNFYKSIYRDGELMRNATTTTIAPTGTIGVIASTSQGIEPIFRLIALRNVKNTLGKDLIEVDRAFREYLTEKGLYDEELIIKIEEKGLNLEDVEEFKDIKEEMKRLFVTTHSVSSEQHIKIQAAFQKYTDNAVSKTINMPNESTVENIAQAYFMAYELGCKGMTVYRDGSRDIQLLTSLKKEEKGVVAFKNQKRPMLIGTTIKQQTPHGKAFITLNCMQNSPLEPYEAFINIGKGGRDIPAIAEGFGRLLSLALQKGVPLKEILSQLEDISGETQTGFGPQKIFSLPDAIAKGLKEAISQLEIKEIKPKTLEEEPDIEKEEKISGNFCPECGGVLMFIEGCQKCNCGYSKC